MKLKSSSLLILFIASAILATSNDCLAKVHKKAHIQKSHTLSNAAPTHAITQNESILQWCANAKQFSNSNQTTIISPPFSKAIALATTPKPSPTAVANSKAPIGDLESIIKQIKEQEESTINLKSVGDSILALRPEITNHPNDLESRQKLGVLLYLAGDYEGAATEFRQIITQAPSSFIAYAMLGKSLADIGDYENSTLEFRHAIALAPSIAAIHYLYAESLVSRGEISEGINEYRRAISIKPSANDWIGLSQSLILAQDIDGAVKAARQAVSEEPNSAKAHVILTKALLLSGDKQSAARTAREALLLNPNSAASHLAMGHSFYANGKVNEAIEEFKQAVSLDPLSGQARNDLGYALYKKGDIVNAINEFRLSLRLNPHLNEARNNLEVAIYGMAKK